MRLIDDGSCAVVIVERNPLFREGLARIIANGKFQITATLSSVTDIATGSLPRNRPLLLVLGSRGDSASTVLEIKASRHQYPDARIAVLGENSDVDDVVTLLRAGADAYLGTVACHDALIKSLELVMSGQTLLTSPILSRILERQDPAGGNDQAHCLVPYDAPLAQSEGTNTPCLSDRERIILGRLIAGDSNKTIARRLGGSEATIKVHVKSILRKIRVLNRTQAAIWASRRGYAPECAEASMPQVEMHEIRMNGG